MKVFKKGSWVQIVSGPNKGQRGIVKRTNSDGTMTVQVDIDGDPLTPPIEVEVPIKWAKALRIINTILSIILPLIYGIWRK